MKATPPKEEKLPKRNTKTPKWFQLQQRNTWVVTGYFLWEKGLACTEAAEICVRNSEKPLGSQGCSGGLWEGKTPGSVTPDPLCKRRWSHCRNGKSSKREPGELHVSWGQGSSAAPGTEEEDAGGSQAELLHVQSSQRGWKAQTTP